MGTQLEEKQLQNFRAEISACLVANDVVCHELIMNSLIRMRSNWHVDPSDRWVQADYTSVVTSLISSYKLSWEICVCLPAGYCAVCGIRRTCAYGVSWPDPSSPYFCLHHQWPFSRIMDGMGSDAPWGMHSCGAELKMKHFSCLSLPGAELRVSSFLQIWHWSHRVIEGKKKRIRFFS